MVDRAGSGGRTRREALRDGAAAGLGLTALGGGLDSLLATASAAVKPGATLKEIEHVVILIQENRSFDHYFGTLSGVRGFGDKKGRAAFTQLDASGKRYTPFHLTQNCLPDLTHEWLPQHQAWDGGKMDGWIREHIAVDYALIGPETMGYYERSDLNFYFALADAFTICDGYHCSVIGPTDPNRLMSMTGTIDPAGAKGGPLVETLVGTRGAKAGAFSWTTMPEQLQARGISWKVYTSPSAGAFDNVLPYFKQFAAGTPLSTLGIDPTYPANFLADMQAHSLPQVSWILTGIVDTEHPGFSSAVAGEVAVRQLLESIVANPKIWAKTALFITWDENGGWFDHVAPPTPPPGTKGEYLTVSTLPDAAGGVRGPIGLGFRVPCLVVSPFSRGGLVCSDTFDHTSLLRFLETRFGAEVPNLSAWRRKHTGDLTSAFNFAAKPNSKRPSLPQPAGAAAGPCPSFPPVAITPQRFPKQERGKRKRPSGIVKR
jgi:phospholipase C